MKTGKTKKPKYGSEEFRAYMQKIMQHPSYSGMPDAIGVSGEIQWEAPSNRSGGQFKDTHKKRRVWWEDKAKSMGVDINQQRQWISRIAKQIHPLKEKPCKNCGRWMALEYRYPNQLLARKLRMLAYVDDAFEISLTEDISALAQRLFDAYGTRALEALCTILVPGGRLPSGTIDIAQCIDMIEKEAVRNESRLLSPGAMSNAPDRFDGFHSFNRCCRQSADKGRSKENLRSYSTDRRAFEYWVDGDWIAADRLMALVRTNKVLRRVACLNATDGGVHPPGCNADHVGPISLGYAHRPQFQFLCGPCNSAKNNRMTLKDVEQLKQAESQGEVVASWFIDELWSKTKGVVVTNEHARRLSKLLRDNRHTYMSVLRKIYTERRYAFLIGLLNIEFADRDPVFVNVGARNHLTVFDRITYSERDSTYAVEQKARRIRVALVTLDNYHVKENRNEHIVLPPQAKRAVGKALSALAVQPREMNELDKVVTTLADRGFKDVAAWRDVANQASTHVLMPPECHQNARKWLCEAMKIVADELSHRWDDDRYARAEN